MAGEDRPPAGPLRRPRRRGGELALDLARRSELLVYTQLPGAGAVARLRRAAEEAGLDATHLQVGQGRLERIHLAGDLADAAVVLAPPPSGLTEAEVLRVLRPRARAWLGEREIHKPVPEGMDDWTHPYHGPDNNPRSRDRLIRAPYLTRFLANPRYGPAPQVAVAAGGRVFKAFGHVAWHEREEPFLQTLVAYNGFNGTVLWRRPLPEGLMVHRNTIIATDERLYLGDDRSAKVLDAATGERTGEIAPPAELAGGTFWKWMALENGVLYALTGEEEQKDPVRRWKRRAHGWPWDQISEGFTQSRQPWGYGKDLLALDPTSGKVLWHHREEEAADARAVCIKNDRLYAFRFERYLISLDAGEGRLLWRRTPENAPELFAALGSELGRQGWQTNWRTTAYLKAGDGALYFAGPQVRQLVAVSAAEGRLLWHDPYDNFQLVIHDDGLYAISGPWGHNESRKFDPLTGAVLARLPVGRRACTRPTATGDSILFRAMGGSVRLDLESARARWISPMRPPCQDGVTVANGLLYWWPYACDCQLSLYGVTALGAAGDFDFQPDPGAPERLERGPGEPQPVVPLETGPADWPTFRANNERTAVTRAAVSPEAAEVWRVRVTPGGEIRPTAPVAAGGLVFLAGTDGAVRALDAASGRERWKQLTGGEVRLPPAIWEGRAFAGSGDGWVYAFEAVTGRLLWRYRAAPAERWIPVYGKLLSTWPAASGVLVEEGTAYVAAGIVNYDGTYVYALDAASGAVRWSNDTSGHLDPEARTGVSVQGHLLFHSGKLYLAGGNAVSPAVYDAATGRCLNDPDPLARCESTSPRGWELFLVGDRVIACGRPFTAHPDQPVYDHTVDEKLLHATDGTRDLVWIDGKILLGFNPLSREELARCVTDEKRPRHITQPWGAFKVSARPRWQHDSPGSVAALLAANAALVADGSRLTALDAGDGRELWSRPLPAPPVEWGLAVDREGRVIASLTDGQVVAFGRGD